MPTFVTRFGRALLVVIAAVSALTVVSIAPAFADDVCPDPDSTRNDLPALTGYRWDAPSDGLRMETWARVSRNVGLVNAEPTHIWSTAKFKGYHGTVSVLMYNRCGDLIGITTPRRYGVDGVWVGQYDRRVFWSQQFDPEVTRRTQSIAILHSRDSDDLLTSLRRYRTVACDFWTQLRGSCPIPSF